MDVFNFTTVKIVTLLTVAVAVAWQWMQLRCETLKLRDTVIETISTTVHTVENLWAAATEGAKMTSGHMDGEHTGMDGLGMDDMDMDDSSSGMSSMEFHFGTDEVVLFSFWTVTDVKSMVYSCVIVFVIGVFYEGLKYFREWLYKYHNNQQKCYKTHETSESNIGSSDAVNGPLLTNRRWTQQMLSGMHCLQTLLHAVQFFVSYLLMLIFMTYNGYLCIAVIVGTAVGFFLFGWQKQAVPNITEHCH